MNLEQVAHFTEHPQELKFQDAAALKTLADKYPFSSVYSLLYLTALSNGKSPDLDLALKQHAYRLTDRTKLYHLLTGGQQAVSGQTVSGTPADDLTTETSSPEGGSGRVAFPEEIKEEIPADLPLTFEQTEETVIVFEAPVHEEPAVEIVQEQITEEDSPTEGITTHMPVAEAATDFDELTEAFTREQHFEVAEPEIVPEAEPLISEQSETVEEEIPEVKNSVEETVKAPVSEGKKSFTSWLHSGQETPVKPEVQPKKPEVNDLIDKFIEQEPSITRAKADFYSPSRKAKESLNEDAVPVSETLAKIYAAQGNYPKAIHVYHQLMLSFPEKKSLFAVQIEELKKKITP